MKKLREIAFNVFLILVGLALAGEIVWLMGWYPDHPTNWYDTAQHPWATD